jgi:hypothetical protein
MFFVQISDLLKGGISDYKRQELMSERNVVVRMIATNDLQLRPNEVDPEQEERHRIFAESKAEQLQKDFAAMAEPSAEELAKRQANALARKKLIADQMFAEQSEVLEEFAKRLEGEGDHRQARIQRQEIGSLRRRIWEQLT